MDRIKEIMSRKGITQQELADEMGVSRVAINKMLNGKPSYTTLEKIALVLDVEMWELFASREEIEGDELTALVSHKGEYYQAHDIEELEEIINKIKNIKL